MIISGIAEPLEINDSTFYHYLNRLVEVGLVQKHQRLVCT